MKKIFYMTVSLLLFGVVSLYGIGSYLIQSHHHKITVKPKDLPLEDVTFQSKSGSMISGWFLQGKPDKGGVLLMHGVKADRLQMLNRARFLFHEGYSVLLFDFQGHGESGGEHITFGYLESLDANAAYRFLKNRLTKKSIGIIGVSLGGASALLGDAAQNAQAVVLESVYPSLEEAISDRLKLYLGSVGSSLTPLLSWQLKPRLGFEANELKPIEHIAKVTAPVFLIAGEKDRHTTLAESKRLFAAATPPKKLWIVKEGLHEDYDALKPELYKEKIVAFFAQTL